MPSTLCSLPAISLILLLPPPVQAQQPVPSSTAYTVDAHTGIRIVRLSQVRGDVEMDRGTEQGFERAFTNFPIIAGARLRTTNGLAEIEFEDNSSLRLAPDTLVHFSTLSRDPTSGVTATTVTVLHGTVFASLLKHDRNPLTLVAGSRAFVLSPGTHLRLALDQPALSLAVLDGAVTVQSPSTSPAIISKSHGLSVSAANPEVATLTGKQSQSDPLALWDRQSVDFHQSTSNLSAFAGNGLFGASDLNYYGSFVSMPGCGSMWRPFFASSSWSPFSVGVWALYPGAGYTFVSPYPWAWTPFHTGAWQQCGSAGWGWSPSANGSWAGLNNASLIASTTRSPTLHPPLQPVHGQAGIIPVNSAPLTASTLSPEHTFVFAQDSAGLGIPRQTFGNLHQASNLVAQHGTANVPVELDAAALHANIGQMRSALTLTALRPAESGMLSPGAHPSSAPQLSTSASDFSPSSSSSHGAATSSAPSTYSHGAAPSSASHASK